MSKLKVLILGGGYAGLAVARGLAGFARAGRLDVTVVDGGEWHTIKTRFHELAVDPARDVLVRLPPKTIAAAYGARFTRARVDSIDFDARTVRVVRRDRGIELEYDRLVLALGAESNFFGVPGAAEYALSLHSYEKAVECGRKVEAALARSGEHRIVVCGAGLEGVEVAAQLRQRYGPHGCEIIVVEKLPRIMNVSSCGDEGRKYVEAWFRRNHVGLALEKGITRVAPGGVYLDNGGSIECDHVIWSSGVRRVETGGITPRVRFVSDEYLRSAGRPEVYATGDFGFVETRRRSANALTAQRAIYHGGIAAVNIAAELHGGRLVKARYRPLGELVSLGDFDGVGNIGGVRTAGFHVAAAKKANEIKYLATVSRIIGI